MNEKEKNQRCLELKRVNNNSRVLQKR